MKARRLILAGVLAFGALAPAMGRGTADGLFTQAQAEEGAQIYAVRCAMCHGRDLAGTVEVPGLRGRFVAYWAGRPVGELFSYMSRAMPQPQPGSLSPEDNARLLAFLLQANGAPTGTRALPSDAAALARINFDPIPASD